MQPDDAQIVDDRPLKNRDVVLWVPDTIGGHAPVKWNSPINDLSEKFETILVNAKDESALQDFFTQAPQALLTGVVSPHRGWVIPKPKVQLPTGGFWEPDFVVCDWTSVGPEWFIVELESPRRSPLIKNGDTSSICNHAINQIYDYRNAIEEHGHFLRGNGWPNLHGKFHGIIVIGRRNDPLRAQHPQKLRQYQHADIEIMSYDRLLETCRNFQSMLSTWADQTAALLSRNGPR